MDPNDVPLAALARALRARRRLIADREFYARDPAGHLAELQRASDGIAEGAAALGATVPPQLAHYLERCSYDKALAWIESAGAGA